MPAAMRMSKAIRTATWRMIIHRMTMVSIITMMSMAITTMITAIPMLMTTNKTPARPRRRAVVRTGINQDAARPIDGQDGMKDGEAAALYRLMTWLSPAFPIGAFSYSSRIEWAGEAGDIGDGASVRDWPSAMPGGRAGVLRGLFS